MIFQSTQSQSPNFDSVFKVALLNIAHGEENRQLKITPNATDSPHKSTVVLPCRGQESHTPGYCPRPFTN